MRRRFKQAEEDIPKEKVLDVDASMQGTLSFKDPVNLRINGRFEGKLDTKGILMVGEHANVTADIFGEDVTIAGYVKGNIVATKELRLISPANVNGEIETPILSVAEGAVINGNIKMSLPTRTSSNTYKEMLSLDEVSRYLEIDKKLVYEWTEAGRLPGIKEGNEWKIDRQALEKWVANEKIS